MKNMVLSFSRQFAWLCSICSWLGLASDWYPFELMTHFRIQYFGALIVCVPIVLLGHRGQNLTLPKFRPALAEFTFFSVSLVLNLALLIGVFVGPLDSAAKQNNNSNVAPIKLSVFQVNVLETNRDFKDICDYVAAKDPDIASFEEVGFEAAKALSTRLVKYPHSKVIARPDFFGLAIFSKYPFTAETLALSKSGVPVLFAVMDVKGRRLNYTSVHTLPPLEPGFLSDRNQEFANLSELRRKNEGPFIVAGDFNCSPWVASFWRLCHDADLKDSEQSFGPQPSWPSYLVLPFIPIDHFLVSKDIKVLSRSIGPYVGSDHYPVEMTISF
jgi:endonuclease/exonuclease/phosphatase (EEP) superfamily protein YafD